MGVVCMCVCVGGKVCWEGGRVGNKGIWLQNWVTVCNTWLPVVKDAQQWGKGWANKDPLEGSLILVGRLTGRSARSTPSQLELGSLCQDKLSSAFQLLNWTAGSFRQAASLPLPSKGCPSTAMQWLYISFPPSKEHKGKHFILVREGVCGVCMRSFSFLVVTVLVWRWSKIPSEGKRNKTDMRE